MTDARTRWARHARARIAKKAAYLLAAVIQTSLALLLGDNPLTGAVDIDSGVDDRSKGNACLVRSMSTIRPVTTPGVRTWWWLTDISGTFSLRDSEIIWVPTDKWRNRGAVDIAQPILSAPAVEYEARRWVGVRINARGGALALLVRRHVWSSLIATRHRDPGWSLHDQ